MSFILMLTFPKRTFIALYNELQWIKTEKKVFFSDKDDGNQRPVIENQQEKDRLPITKKTNSTTNLWKCIKFVRENCVGGEHGFLCGG